MRLRQLNLTRYGHFTDFTLDFGERPVNGSDFHIIFGNNEAGKSTAFNGYLDLLFGIGERSKFNFLHEYNALCIGAVLEIEKTTIKLERIKRRGATLIGANSQPVDEEILTTALHGLSREAYEAMFSLNDKTLEQGGNEILASKGDFGKLLFSGTAGLTDLSTELQILQDHANKIYSDGSRKHEFATLLQQLKQLKDDKKNLDTQSTKFKHLTETHHKAKEAYQLARDALDNIREEQTNLKKLKDAFAIQDDLLALEKKLLPVNHLPDVPKGWIEEVKNLQARFDAAEEKKDTAQIDIDDSKKELENLITDPIIIKMKGSFRTLATLAAHDLAAKEQLPKLREKLLKTNTDLEETRQRLGANKTIKSADLVLPDDTIDALETLSQNEAQLIQRLETAKQEASDAKEALQEAKDEEKQAAPPDDKVTKLVALFEKYSEEDAQQCLNLAEQNLLKTGRKIKGELSKVAPWSGKKDNISSLALPTPSQANRWCEKSKLLEFELAEQKTQQKHLKMSRTKHESRMKTLSKQSGNITDANAANSRAARDSAWSMHRESLDDKTADAFEKVLIVDDHIHEERLAATERLTQLRNEELELAEIDSTLNAIAEEITQTESKLKTFQDKLRPDLIKIGLPKDFPVENLPSWLERIQTVRDLIEEEEEHCAERDLAKSNYDQQRVTLLEALAKVGQKLSKNSTLEELFLAIKPYQKAVIKGDDRHDLAKKAVLKAEVYLRHRDKALKVIVDEFEKWKKNWKHTVEGLWLKQKNVSQIRTLITPLRRLTDLANQQNAFMESILAKEKDCQNFREEVCKLIHSLKLKVEDDIRAQFLHLTERLENAQNAETSRAVAASSQANAEKQLMKAETELSRIKNRIKEMTSYFPTSEGITTLDNLAYLLDQAKEKFELANAVSEKEHILLQDLGVNSRSDAEKKLKDKTLLEIETKLTKIEADLKEADLELENRVEERRDALRAIEAISDDASVALLDEKLQTLLLEISNKANRALALHLGLMAADNALLAYRDRHRSELLTQTGDAFRAITAGEFSRLTTQPDQSCDRLIAIRSNGGSIAAEEMSKGTRFQLYLSLRLAAYRRFCNVKGPLPFFGDDIMETFDDHRAEAAMRQLSEIAKNGQVLYFTHHRHLCEIAKHTFGKGVIIHEIPK